MSSVGRPDLGQRVARHGWKCVPHGVGVFDVDSDDHEFSWSMVAACMWGASILARRVGHAVSRSLMNLMIWRMRAESLSVDCLAIGRD